MSKSAKDALSGHTSVHACVSATLGNSEWQEGLTSRAASAIGTTIAEDGSAAGGRKVCERVRNRGCSHTDGRQCGDGAPSDKDRIEAAQGAVVCLQKKA